MTGTCALGASLPATNEIVKSITTRSVKQRCGNLDMMDFCLSTTAALLTGGMNERGRFEAGNESFSPARVLSTLAGIMTANESDKPVVWKD